MPSLVLTPAAGGRVRVATRYRTDADHPETVNPLSSARWQSGGCLLTSITLLSLKKSLRLNEAQRL